MLIGPFRFAALEAVVLNKAMSLVVVAFSLIARAREVPVDAIAREWSVILNLWVGTLPGAWLGAGWAVRMRSDLLHRVIAVLLLAIALVLLLGHRHDEMGLVDAGWARMSVGAIAGFAIGVAAALLGVAGGELLIPTLLLIFGVEIKLAGSLSLAVSLPTMLVSFARYSRDQSFDVIARRRTFALLMARDPSRAP